MSIFTNTFVSEIKGHIGQTYQSRTLENNNRHLNFICNSSFFYNLLVERNANYYLIAPTILNENYFYIKNSNYYGILGKEFLLVRQIDSIFKTVDNVNYNFQIGSAVNFYYIKDNNSYSSCVYSWPLVLKISKEKTVFSEEKDNSSYNTLFDFFDSFTNVNIGLDIYYGS